MKVYLAENKVFVKLLSTCEGFFCREQRFGVCEGFECM